MSYPAFTERSLPDAGWLQGDAGWVQEFFARPQACLRGSPLPKTYGWRLLFDDDGRVALCAVESPVYQPHPTSATPTGPG